MHPPQERGAVDYQEEGHTIAHIRVQLAAQYSVRGRRTRSPIARVICAHRFGPDETSELYVLFNQDWLRERRANLPEYLYGTYFRAQLNGRGAGSGYTVPAIGADFMLHKAGDNLMLNNVEYVRGDYLTRGEITRLRFEGDRQILALLPWRMGSYNNILTVTRELTEEYPTLYIGPAPSHSLHHFPIKGATLISAYGEDNFTFWIAETEHHLRGRGNTWLLDDDPIMPINHASYIFFVDVDDSLIIV